MNNSTTHESNVSVTISPCRPTNLPVALKTTTCSPTNLEPSQRIDLICRYGAHFDATSKFGDPAWRIDLYRRDTIISGFALQCNIERFPVVDALVRIEGIVILGGESPSIWVRSWEPIETLPPQDCIFDTALPNWIADRNIVDRACALWASLPAEDRRFVNAVFLDPQVLRGFLAAPASCAHHHAHDGGCIEHSVQTAEMAESMAAQSPHLDRDLLVTLALVHDSGKALEYEKTRSGRWRMSSCGRRVGHKVSGIRLASLALSHCPEMAPRRKESLFHLLSCSFAPSWVGLRTPDMDEARVFSAIDRLSAEAGRYPRMG